MVSEQLQMSFDTDYQCDIAVCGECFNDEGIKGFIEENATDEECSFCGATSEEPIGAPIREVARFIEDGIGREYGNPDECGMSWDSEDQRYRPGETYDTSDLVSEHVDLPNDQHGKLYWQSAAGSAETLGHPLTLATTLCYAAHVHIFRHEPSATADYAGRALRICEEHHIAQFHAYALHLNGWALDASGQSEKG
jgi:hypothetical protein